MKKPNYVFDDELYHWGIKGQKWGDRRYQNEDGSLTPEGRERYGKGGDRIKIERAKATYNTQKYKADLKSKAQREKDIRAAQEERNRIKENSNTMLLARKSQGKFDRLNKKEEAKLNNQGRPKASLGKTKNMSDEELQNAINRLKLQAEYNKQYVLATQPNSMLVKADRFFEGPTGKFVADLAVRTLPDITKTVVSKALEKDKGLSDLEKREKEATIAKNLGEANSKQAAAEKIRAELMKDKYEYDWNKNADTGNLTFTSKAEIAAKAKAEEEARAAKAKKEEEERAKRLFAINRKRR